MDQHVPPVIMIGMHRSGTSMVARLLRDLGLFIGWDIQQNYEANFFADRNERLLRECGGGWEQPEAIDSLLGDPAKRQGAADTLRRDVASGACLSFLGPRLYLTGGSIRQMDRPWGWKDPRNTYLLPLWLDLFPDARILHIYRNGIDVARSLQTREVRRLARHRVPTGVFARQSLGVSEMTNPSPFLFLWRKAQSLKRRLRRRPSASADSERACVSLEAGFDLWARYVERAAHAVEQARTPALQLRYEDFLADPKTHLTAMTKFCGLTVAPDRMDVICESIDPERRFAFKDSKDGVAFYETVRNHPWMRKLGYDSL